MGRDPRSRTGPRRALVVSHEASRTGAPVVAGHLIRSLRHAGYRTVVVHRWGGPREAELTAAADEGRPEPLRRLRVALGRIRRRGWADRLERWSARRVIRRTDPDVVWCNTVVTWRFAEEAARAGIPTVLYGHEQADWGGAGLRQALRAAPPGVTLAACSSAAAEVMADWAGREPDDIVLLHSPVDVDDVIHRAGASGPTAGSSTVVACGTADERKGFDVFSAAAERSTRDDPRTRWRWVGREPAEGVDIYRMVDFTGEVPDAVPVLATADVMVCPSRSDSFPLVVLEAMALARPVVASELPGIAEQLGDTGILVPVGDADALSAEVAGLLADPERASDLGRRAQARVRTLWGIDRFRSRVAEITEHAVADPPTRPLRVAHVMGRLSAGGGVQVVVRRLARHAEPGRLELHVITMRPAWDDLGDLPVVLHPLGHGGASLRPWHRARIMVGAAREVRRIRPDVVQLHSGIAWMGILARVTAPRTPFVLEVHDAPGSGRHGRHTDRFEGWCVRFLGMTAACHSTQVEDALRSVSRVPRSRIRRFPLGIDTTVFAPIDPSERDRVRQELGLGSSTFVAVAIGRPAPSKRFDLAIDAVATVRDRGVDAALVLVGVGEDPGLVARRHERGLDRHVRLLDGRFGADLAALIGSADVLVSASDYEGFGLTLIEAMACARPVVAAAAGGVTDIVIDGETGFLVEPGSADALADRLVEVAIDSDLRDRLGATGRRRAQELFDAGMTARRFVETYRDLAGSRRR